jgi:Rap1a immunity proteins
MLRSKFIALILAVFMVSTLPLVLAQDGPERLGDDGNELFREFQSREKLHLKSIRPSDEGWDGAIFDNGLYIGYVWGVFESLSSSGAICPDGSVNTGQTADVVSNYLKSHPEIRHHRAIDLVSDAF